MFSQAIKSNWRCKWRTFKNSNVVLLYYYLKLDKHKHVQFTFICWAFIISYAKIQPCFKCFAKFWNKFKKKSRRYDFFLFFFFKNKQTHYNLNFIRFILIYVSSVSTRCYIIGRRDRTARHVSSGIEHWKLTIENGPMQNIASLIQWDFIIKSMFSCVCLFFAHLLHTSSNLLMTRKKTWKRQT